MPRPRDSYVVLRSTVSQAGDGSNSNPDSGHALSPMSGAMPDVLALHVLSEAAAASPGSIGLAQPFAEKVHSNPKRDKRRRNDRHQPDLLARQFEIDACHIGQHDRDIPGNAERREDRQRVDSVFHFAFPCQSSCILTVIAPRRCDAAHKCDFALLQLASGHNDIGSDLTKDCFFDCETSKREKSKKGPFIDLPKRRAGALPPKLIE